MDRPITDHQTKYAHGFGRRRDCIRAAAREIEETKETPEALIDKVGQRPGQKKNVERLFSIRWSSRVTASGSRRNSP